MSQKTADTNVNGATAQGEALATLFNEHCAGEGSRLMRFMKDLFELSLDGRKAFRVRVTAILKEWRDLVNSHEGTDKEELYKRMSRSAGVRLSEAVTISKAFDAGFNPIFELSSTNTIVVKVGKEYAGYHALVGFARQFMDAQASNGPTVKRGRKAKDDLTKAIEFLGKLQLSEADKEALIAQLSGHNQAAAAPF